MRSPPGFAWTLACSEDTVPLMRALSDRGFSLLEVLIATAIAITAAGALAQLAVVGSSAVAVARSATLASVLAHEKIEQLRSLAWAYDPNGDPVSDAALVAPTVDSLTSNIAGYCDFIDGRGNWLASGPAPPPGATYVRRWRFAPLSTSPNQTIVVEVAVYLPPRRAPLAHLVDVRTRRAP